MKKPQSIHSILKQTLKGLQLEVPLKTHSIWSAWKEIVGESVSLHAQPRSVRNRILFVEVSHSTWVQQLQFLKTTLLEKINAFLGEPLIEDIRFRLGKIPQKAPFLLKIDDWIDEKLDKRTMNQIERHLEKIDDAEVKRGLREVLIKGAKLEQYRKKLK
ncbi:MAG: DUF721 domain-containing protein [Thermodesulfobacteriota bacterium]|nr:DUF721 domain-containing protein [Thermodesulfobacteriota bacterium]